MSVQTLIIGASQQPLMFRTLQQSNSPTVQSSIIKFRRPAWVGYLLLHHISFPLSAKELWTWWRMQTNWGEETFFKNRKNLFWTDLVNINNNVEDREGDKSSIELKWDNDRCETNALWKKIICFDGIIVLSIYFLVTGEETETRDQLLGSSYSPIPFL